MRNTNLDSLSPLIAIVCLVLLAAAGLDIAGPIAGILLAGTIITIAKGLIRGAYCIAAAKVAGDADALARSHSDMRPYEVGCLILVLVPSAFLFLFPLLLPNPGSGKKTKSLNNIKQLAIAVQTYAQDYNETFPGWVRNPDGAYAHNTWDEQIDGQVKAKGAFNNGDTGIRSYSDPTRSRVLTYGLNGLLIAPPKGDGNADFESASAAHPPAPLRPGAIRSPATTILFAELSTNAPMPGVYGQPPNPSPFTGRPGTGSPQWQGARDGWIDISPRAWVENGGPGGSYHEPYADGVAEYGAEREQYGGGGVYAFCDGHAKFMKIADTVGIGTTTKTGLKITEANCWSPENTNNMWVPR